MSVREELDRFGKYVVQQSKSNLSKEDKNDSKSLYNSIGYQLEIFPNSFSLSFTMEDYGEFVDKGVKGVSSSAKAPKSPFKFGTGTGKKGGLTKGIDGWVKRKRLQFRERGTGKFISYESTAFLIRRSIWHKGIETTNFFTRPFERAFARLSDDIVESYGLEVDNLLKMALR